MLETGDPSGAIYARGIAFYHRLATKSDAALSAGNFSREEVEEGLAQLERRKDSVCRGPIMEMNNLCG